MPVYICRVCDKGEVRKNGKIYICGSCSCIYTEYNIMKLIPACEDETELSTDKQTEPDNSGSESIYESTLLALKNSRDEKTLLWAADRFALIPGCKDSAEQRNRCLAEAEMKRKDGLYFTAVEIMSRGTIADLGEAKEIFLKIKGFRNADELAVECENDILYYESEKLIKSTDFEEFEQAITNFKKLGKWRDSAEIVSKYRPGTVVA